MDVLNGLVLGFFVAVTPLALGVCFIGVLLGTLIGVLPGIGPVATIAMLLPITTSLSPPHALIMLAGIFYGAQYGGSTTAILVNIPGEPSSAVTAIDGYEMAKKGRAGAALTIAAIASFVAGCIATFVIAIFAPALAKVVVAFGAPEYFALATFGLVLTVALTHGSLLKGLAMALVGVLIGLTGSDLFTNATRFTFGFEELRGGIDFVGVAVGIFGISEIMTNLERGKEKRAVTVKISKLLPTASEFKDSIGPTLRGTALGSILGVLPGGGAFLSSVTSYAIEKRLSKDATQFGKGAIAGVAGPESANNAGAQTSFIPMLTVGIPSNPVMALMIGAMIIQGIIPGPQVISRQPELFWGLIASMWIGNVMLIILNLPLVGLWVKLLEVPYSVLFPAILTFACIGTFSANGDVTDLFVLACAGVFGYTMQRVGAEPAPLLLGFVLARMLEDQFRLAMMLSDGNPLIFLSRPISGALIVLAVTVLAATVLPRLKTKNGNP